MPHDFEGWATKNDLRCADGVIIRKDAFKVQSGQKVPLVWNHQHNSVGNVLGHALLENREEGVYAYCSFNDSDEGKGAKERVKHGDVTSLSIWANNLEKVGKDIIHGVIREVSLVLASANPGACIESVIVHGELMDDEEDEGIIYTGDNIFITHADEIKNNGGDTPKDDEKPDQKDDNMTVKDVIDTMNDNQKKAMAIVVGQAVADAKSEKKENDEKKEESEMKHNAFEGSNSGRAIISHSDMETILKDAQKMGKLSDAISFHLQEGGILAHSLDTTGMETSKGNQTYGFNDPSMLFPDYKALNTTPEWISRNMDWVSKLMSKVHRTPFSRIKTVFADITEDEARAKGYMKGNRKKDEVFSILKRTTDPQTFYKKQKMDRDDIIDIVDFDVLAWIKAEMEMMLNEEEARAILVGDGRPADSEDKIKEQHIRPIAKDDPLFNTIIKVKVPEDADEAMIANATIKAIIRGRKNYKGSGKPDFWTTEDVTTEMLLLEDAVGHSLYKTETELATKLRVSEIIPVEPMEGMKIEVRENGSYVEYPLLGIIVNMADYNVGRDKGGENDFHEAFDIDYNQQKYLLERRQSGALVKPFSALTVVLVKIKKAAGSNGNSSDEGDQS